MSDLLSPILNHMSGGLLAFWCPGCEAIHMVPVTGLDGRIVGWDWNRSVDKPTFGPSIKVTSGHYMDGHKGNCWCDYNRDRPESERAFECRICHSHVIDGNIVYLNDCTHSLAGQTVAIPDWPQHD